MSNEAQGPLRARMVKFLMLFGHVFPPAPHMEVEQQPCSDTIPQVKLPTQPGPTFLPLNSSSYCGMPWYSWPSKNPCTHRPGQIAFGPAEGHACVTECHGKSWRACIPGATGFEQTGRAELHLEEYFL